MKTLTYVEWKPFPQTTPISETRDVDTQYLVAIGHPYKFVTVAAWVQNDFWVGWGSSRGTRFTSRVDAFALMPPYNFDKDTHQSDADLAWDHVEAIRVAAHVSDDDTDFVMKRKLNFIKAELKAAMEDLGMKEDEDV